MSVLFPRPASYAVARAEQTQAEFQGASFRVRCRLAGPALPDWIHGPAIVRRLAALQDDSSLVMRAVYEDEALALLLRGLVRDGLALAYLPEFALRDERLVHVAVSDLPFECTEQAWLAWRPTVADGWQARLVAALS